MKNVNDDRVLNAYCPKCEQTTGVSYVLKQVPFSDGKGYCEIIAGKCVLCNTVTYLPKSSIKEAKRQYVIRDIELEDILDITPNYVEVDCKKLTRYKCKCCDRVVSGYTSSRIPPVSLGNGSTVSIVLCDYCDAVVLDVFKGVDCIIKDTVKGK